MYNIASPVAKNKTNKFYSTLCCLTLVFLGIKLINAHQQAPGLYQWLPTETRSELLKYPSFPRWVVEPTAWWENCETPGENPDFIWNVLHRSNLTKKHRILPYFAREHVNSIRVEKIVHLPLGLQTGIWSPHMPLAYGDGTCQTWNPLVNLEGPWGAYVFGLHLVSFHCILSVFGYKPHGCSKTLIWGVVLRRKILV